MNRTPNRPRASTELLSVSRHPPRRRRFAGRALVGFVAVFLSVTLVGQPAWAHGGQSATEGYVMVQQALSYLVNDSSPTGTANALGKVDEALAAADQDGVNVAEVQQAKSALSAGDTAAARKLLQTSISDAVAALKPAVGEETGTSIMLPPFTQGPISVTGWVFLLLSALVAIGGAILAMLFRPREGMRQLRRDILAADGRRSPSPQLNSNGRDHDDH